MAATFDAVASDVRQPAIANPTWTHVVGSGATLIVICTSLRSGTSNTVTAVTVGGVSATKVGSSLNGGVPNTEIWALLDPPSGSQTVSVTYSAAPSQKSVQGSTSYFGTTSPLPTTVTAQAYASTTSASVSRTCVVGDLVVDSCSVHTSAVDTPGSSPQVEAYAASNTTSAYIRGMSSYVLDTASTSQTTTYSWTGNFPRLFISTNFSPSAAAASYLPPVRRNRLPHARM